MTTPKLTVAIFVIINFVVGFIFGTLGHLYSIIIFPVLAMLQGTVVALLLNSQPSDEVRRKSIQGAIVCGTAYFAGISTGVLNLIFVFLPSSESYQENFGPLFETGGGIANALGGSVVCGGIYLIGYIIISILAAMLTMKIQDS